MTEVVALPPVYTGASATTFWPAVCALTREQHGVVSTAQVLGTGADKAWLEWAVRDGRLSRTRRGVYAATGGAAPPFQPLMAACLAAGDRAFASHLAAGWCWGSPDIAAGALQLTIFGACSARLPGVTVRRSTLDPSGFTTLRDAIPVVTAPLTVVQLATIVHPKLVAKVASDLVDRGHTTFRAILDCVELIGTNGRKGAQGVREMCLRELEVAGHDDSPAARRLGRAMLRAGIPPFETQYEVVVDGAIYHLDFAWPNQMVGLEYMGWKDHGQRRRAFDNDAARRNRLATAGWRILDATSGLSQRDIIRWLLATLA